MVDRAGWERIFEAIPPPSAEDEPLLPRAFIEQIYLQAEILVERFGLGELNAKEESDRYSLIQWDNEALKPFFERYPDLLLFRVGSKEVSAYEIRPVSISEGDLGLYSEIKLPPGFTFTLRGAHKTQLHHNPHGEEIFLFNPTRGLAHQADTTAQESTGIAVDLEQIRLNRQNGGDITIPSQIQADPQARAE